MSLMVMLEIGGMGMIRRLTWKERFLTDHNRATIVISDYHQTIWVWQGSNIVPKTRLKVPPKIEEIQTKGFSLDGEVLGLNCKNVFIIDDAIMSTGQTAEAQTMASAYQQLLQMVQSTAVIPHTTSRYIVEAAEAARAAAQVGVTEGAQDPRNDSFAGILLACILREFPESFVHRTNQGEYQVETGAGSKFNYKFQNFQLKLLPNSNEIPSTVMRHFQMLTKA